MVNIKKKQTIFWSGPKLKFKEPVKGKRRPKPLFKPVRLNNKKYVKTINTKHLTWPQALIRYPNMKAFGDKDKDGILNGWDCKPFNNKKHGFSHQYSFSRSDNELKTVMMPPTMFLETTWADTKRTIQAHKQQDLKRNVKPKYKYQYEDTDYEGYKKDFAEKKKAMKEISQKIKSKSEHIPVPFLEFNREGENIGHEGRHTSVASMKSKLKYMPVTLQYPKGTKLSPEYERLKTVKGKQYTDYSDMIKDSNDYEEAKNKTTIEAKELEEENEELEDIETLQSLKDELKEDL